MRAKKTLTLTLPNEVIAKIDKYKETNPSLTIDRDFLYYIVDYLYYLESINRKKKKEFVQLKTPHLKGLIKSNLNYYLKEMKSNKIIACDDKAVAGEKSFHYKSIELTNDSTSEVTINKEGKLYKAITKASYLKNKNDNRLAPHLKQMKKKFIGIVFDSKKAITFANKNYSGNQLCCILSSINKMKSPKTRFFDRCKTNKRLDTNITNLKSELRQFIVGDYVNIDLKNSQPYLLSCVVNRLINLSDFNYDTTFTLCSIKENEKAIKSLTREAIEAFELIPQLLSRGLSEEIITFTKKCTEGVLYEHFLELDAFKNLTRDEVKEIMMEVLFSQNYYKKNGKKRVPYKDNKNKFKSKYPGIFEIVECLKAKKHQRLAVALQLEESYVFIDVVAKKLCEADIIPITIHDSIVVEKEHQERALEVVYKAFDERYNNRPTFHVNPL